MSDDDQTRRVDPAEQLAVRGLTAGQLCFGRYTLLTQAGRGGMGVVWRVRDQKLEREVALKFLPEAVRSDSEAIRDLKRETVQSLELTHPHVVRVYDFVEDGSATAIAMEFIDGSSLAALKTAQPRGCFEAAELAAWVAQLCSALDYAHGTARVVHRDLKPANLLITRDGRLKVADFGIARSLTETQTRLTRDARGTSGTLLFMSPQQLLGQKASAADDLYALGATLYDLLTGKPPFYSGDVSLQVCDVPPRSLAERRIELGTSGAPIPLEWEQAIAALLAKDPAKRPQSAGEVATRLGLAPALGTATQDRVSAKINVAPAALAGSVPPSPPATPPAKSRTALYAGLAAAVVALLAAGYYFGVHRPEQARLAAARLAEEANWARLEKADAESRLKAEQTEAAAKVKAEQEEKDYAVLMARIESVDAGTHFTQIEAIGAAVSAYLGTAPDRYKLDVSTAWTKRQTEWEMAKRAGMARLENEKRAAAQLGKAGNKGVMADKSQAGGADSKNAVVLRNRALAKFRQGDYAGAIADYTRVIALEPRNVAAYRARAAAKRKLGNIAGAEADERTALNLQAGGR